MQKKSRKTLSQHKLLKYSAAATAAVAAGHTADAAINVVDVSGFDSIDLSGANIISQTIILDLNGDSDPDLGFFGSRYSFTSTAGGPVVTYSSARMAFRSPIAGGRFGQTTGGARKLSPSSDLAGLNFISGAFTLVSSTSENQLLSGSFIPDSSGSDSGLLGFSFDIDGNTHYAWLEVLVSLEGNRLAGLEILSGAYEDVAGASILTGAVPEPASVSMGLGLMALGAVGVRSMRRRRD